MQWKRRKETNIRENLSNHLLNGMHQHSLLFYLHPYVSIPFSVSSLFPLVFLFNSFPSLCHFLLNMFTDDCDSSTSITRFQAGVRSIITLHCWVPQVSRWFLVWSRHTSRTYEYLVQIAQTANIRPRTLISPLCIFASKNKIGHLKIFHCKTRRKQIIPPLASI